LSVAEQKSLRRKLFLARKAAEAVAKNGHSADGDFTFARFEDVLAEASKQLEKRDILYVPSMVEEELVLGKQGVIAKAVIEYEVTDTKTGESLKVRWAGTGYDRPGDKALFKATTGTEKYFLARLLGIPFGTDPEAELGPASDPVGSDDADRIRREQDEAAEEPHLAPLPKSDLPEPDWARGEEQVCLKSSP
jgi:ERF superfamily